MKQKEAKRSKKWSKGAKQSSANNKALVNIFLDTDDLKAVDQFMTNAPNYWNMWVDQFYHSIFFKE